MSRRRPFRDNVADAHLVIHLEGAGYDIFPVQILIDDAAADRVAIEADQKVEQRRAVTDHDVLRAVPGAQDLLGVVEGIVLALLVGEAGIRLEILKPDGLLSGERAGCADEDVGLRREEKVKFQAAFPHDLPENRLIETIQVEDADRAPVLGDVVQDFPGLRLADAEIILRAAVLSEQLGKCLDREGVVLRGDAELVPGRRLPQVLLPDQVHLLRDLPRVAEKFLTIGRHCNPVVCAVENADAELIFQLMDCGREARLGEKKPAGSLGDASRLRDENDIIQLI